MQISFGVNGETQTLDVDPSTPLLWVLRDHLGKTGTKFGCGVAQCGACTVHINGSAVRSCVVPVEAVRDASVVTIEGLSGTPQRVLQDVWVDLNVPQCGYCQAGMLMAAASLLKTTPRPTNDDIDASVSNICRCGTYTRVRAAIHEAARRMQIAAGKS